MKNRITLYRKRMRFSQAYVAELLGHRDSSTLCNYENGRQLPGLTVALQLAVILRTPVEFLFPELFNALQKQIREHEEDLRNVNQNVQPHHSRLPT